MGRYRRTGSRVLLAVEGFTAICKARLAYALSGMEGVNRVLFFARKRQIIPVLRRFAANVGANCDLEAPLVVHNARHRYANLSIGPDCHIGKEVFIDLADKVTISARVTISMRVLILTHTDVGRSPLANELMPAEYKAVTIGTGAYIGAGATLLPGVNIGEGSVIGAGAVVTKSVDPHTTVCGVPARPIRSHSKAVVP